MLILQKRLDGASAVWFDSRKENIMKKAIIFISSVLLIFASMVIVSKAAEIEILAPSDSELQIAPTRDFYVVGAIKRTDSAEKEPLNIKVELSDADGNVIRSIVSNVETNGITSNQYIITDYEGSIISDDTKGVNLYTYPPADAVYDGWERDSIRLPSKKIVVRDGYFAAIIYGGASKNYDLNYIDEHEAPLKDITEGEYTLTVTALNMDNDEVCSAEKTINVGSNASRLIYNLSVADKNDIQSFAESTGSVVSNSIVGYWHPYDFVSAPSTFSYILTARLLYNLMAELGETDEVKLLLYAADISDKVMNLSIGSAASPDSSSSISYFYYDIGEPSVTFDFAGDKLTKKGELVDAEDDVFVKLLRAETYYDEITHADFNPDDGVVLTSNCETVFSGVYSPINLSASRKDGGTYVITDRCANIKVMISDKKNNLLYETECEPFIKRQYDDETSFSSRYEFKFSVEADETMISDDCSLTVMLLDSNEKVICSETISCVIKKQGDFFAEYSDSYWGKSYCDEVNMFGASPSGEAIEPDEAILRGDFAAMINRLFGFTEKGSADFSDIDESDVYYNEVLTARAAGYMSGDEQSRINAHDPITREEAIIVLSRISGAEQGDFEIDFKDYDDISFWALDEVNLMCSTGIITGFDGYLNPRESITAAEAAALICKTITWMYRGRDYSPEAIVPSVSLPNFDSEELSEVELSDVTEAEVVDRSELESFITNNLVVLDSLKNYILASCPDGIYVKKVGTGLEVRDYRLGLNIALSSDAVRILTELSTRYPSFTLKYNPASEDIISFAFANDENNKEFGIAFSVSGESQNKELESIFGNWYYFIIK